MTPEQALELFIQLKKQVSATGETHDKLNEALIVLSKVIYELASFRGNDGNNIS